MTNQFFPSFSAVITSLMIASPALAANPLAKIQFTNLQTVSRTVTLMDNGSVEITQNGKSSQAMTLNPELLKVVSDAIEGITVPVKLVDLTPQAPVCPGHTAAQYQIFTKGSPAVVFQIASNCHKFGPEFPAGGKTGAELTQYQDVDQVVTTLDDINALYSRLKYGQ